jgi:pimeloyl-ACP methyl ester carboxylesterase
MRMSAAATIVVFVLVGCSAGGGGNSTQRQLSEPATRAPVTATTGAGVGPTREITITVHGRRRIAGQCDGSPHAGTATVVLDSGQGSDRTQLSDIAAALIHRAMVCSYDRAGDGASDPAPPRPITDLVSDQYAWLKQGRVPPPYFLIGQSQGGADAVLFAVEHPADIAGFVAMNPGSPCALYLRTVAKIMTRAELASEVANCRGDNNEGVDLRPGSTVMHAKLPPSIPYAIMYGWLCRGDEFCRRVRPVESADEARLADLGEGGRFIDVAGADHEIYETHMAEVLRSINQIWQQTAH